MKRILSILLITTMIISLSACGSTETSSNDDRVKELEARISELESQNAELRQQLGESSQETTGSNNTSSVSASINESTAETWGVCGADLIWYYANGILVIRGTGDMTDFSGDPWYSDSNDHPWRDLHDKIQWVYIEDGVTSIGENAFLRCEYVSRVEISNSVTSIGKQAFYGCESLTSITIPGNVTSIGEYAFARCLLTSIIIPDSVTSIGSHAFDRCPLTNITIPDSVTSIESDAFSNCHLDEDTIEKIRMINPEARFD